jgi:outer membrane immunogenic protein
MKNLATVIAIAGLIGTPAFAADIGVPPAPPPAPVYNWTGWYVGVNAGASFGNVKTDFNVGPYTVAQSLPVVLVPVFATFPGVAFSDTSQPSGFMGGGQIGYNWQWSPLIVLGFEADRQYSDNNSAYGLHDKNRMVRHGASARWLCVGEWECV